MTALHHAAMKGHPACIAELVLLGADVDATLPVGTRLIQVPDYTTFCTREF